jgi:two-component system chemotaxis response regulator CheY
MIVLIVDDNTFMRTILKDLVIQTKWADAKIVEAASGDEAIAICKTQKPDLILLDVVMPGKDGIEVLKEIDPTKFPVVMVSSVGQEYIIEHAKSLGIKDYILKPVDPALVIESLNKLFTSQPDKTQSKA